MAVLQYNPSGLATMNDLDGFSGHNDFYHNIHPQQVFQTTEEDEFGFDPPSKLSLVKLEHSHTPPQDRDLFAKPSSQFNLFKQESSTIRALELDAISHQRLSKETTAISRYGQVTPPRSNSTTSVEAQDTKLGERRRCASRVLPRDDQSTLSVAGRRRRSARKLSADSTNNPEDDEKRKQSLEKNRLAAAKCRVNKKEKTEQLQQDSHDKAVQNAFLKDQVLRMKEEVQQMNALLLAHANCDGCKSPEDIQRHLTHLGHEFYAQQVAGLTQANYPAYPADLARYQPDHRMEPDYFSPIEQHDMMNPPLPDFDRESNFDIATPMHTD